MKKYILNIVYATLIILIIDWLALLCDLNPLSTAFLFVIPLGGLIFGWILGAMAESGLKKGAVLYEKKYSIITAVYACVLLFILTYFGYLTCYITDEMEISHLFNGEHISNFLYNDTPVNFFQYFKMEYIDTTLGIAIRGNRSNPTDTGISGLGIIIYVLNYIAISVVTYKIVDSLKNAPLCDSCKQYYDEKEIDRFLEGSSEQSILNKLSTGIEGGHYYQPENKNADAYSYSVKTTFCPSCFKGVVSIYAHVPSGKNHKDVLYKNYNATPEQIRMFNGRDKKSRNNPSEQHVLRDIKVTPVSETRQYKSGAIPVDLSDDVVKQLRNLKSLYDEGILTEEEYQDKRNQILGK